MRSKARLRSVAYGTDDKVSTRSHHRCTPKPRFRSGDPPWPSSLRMVHKSVRLLRPKSTLILSRTIRSVATGTQWSGPTKSPIEYELMPGRAIESDGGSDRLAQTLRCLLRTLVRRRPAILRHCLVSSAVRTPLWSLSCWWNAVSRSIMCSRQNRPKNRRIPSKLCSTKQMYIQVHLRLAWKHDSTKHINGS